MIWVLGFCITFFSLLSGGLLAHQTGLSKNVIWLVSLLIIPAVFLYLHIGRPKLPDHPYLKIQHLSTPQKLLNARLEIPTQQALVRLTSKDAKAWYKLGQLYQETKQFYKAALILREAWKLSPESYDYKLAYTQALIFFNNGKISATALKLLKELHKEKAGDHIVASLMPLNQES